MVPRGRLWDGYWVAKVSAGDFVGLSTMLNNISKVQRVSVTGSWSSCGSVLLIFEMGCRTCEKGVLGHSWDGYSVSYITVGGIMGLSTMMNNIFKDGRMGITES